MDINLEELRSAVTSLDDARVDDILAEFVSSEPDSDEVLKVIETCQQGMENIGEMFERGEYFIGDLVFAGALFSSSLEKMKTFFGQNFREDNKGIVLLGTVQGDIHYIGKNIYKIMLEAAGYKVFDIGIDQPPEAFVETARKIHADVVGLSGLLTVSVESMKKTIDAFKSAGLTSKIRIEIGGSVVNEAARKYTGADDWSTNAYTAVQKLKRWNKQQS